LKIFVILEWQTKPLNLQEGNNSFFLQCDSSLDYPENSFFMWSNSQGWMSISSTPINEDGKISLILSD